MFAGLLGKKKGMMQIFDEAGNCIPVTILQIGPCTVTQKKTQKKEGYSAVQIGYGQIKEKKLNKPALGHFKKNGLKPFRYLREFRICDEGSYDLGQELEIKLFQAGDRVDVIGTAKGKGFQGVIKRHGHSGGPGAHGSRLHRSTGSIGQCTTPGEVKKGHPLPGHMGAHRVTTQNLMIVEVRPEDQSLLAKGAVPGPNGGLVFIRLDATTFENRLKEAQKSEATEHPHSSRLNHDACHFP